jgi:hypothetical protein
MSETNLKMIKRNQAIDNMLETRETKIGRCTELEENMFIWQSDSMQIIEKLNNG